MLENYVPRRPGQSGQGGEPAVAPTKTSVSETKSSSAVLIESVAASMAQEKRQEVVSRKDIILVDDAPGIQARGKITPTAKAALTGSIMIPTAAGGTERVHSECIYS